MSHAFSTEQIAATAVLVTAAAMFLTAAARLISAVRRRSQPPVLVPE